MSLRSLSYGVRERTQSSGPPLSATSWKSVFRFGKETKKYGIGIEGIPAPAVHINGDDYDDNDQDHRSPGTYRLHIDHITPASTLRSHNSSFSPYGPSPPPSYPFDITPPAGDDQYSDNSSPTQSSESTSPPRMTAPAGHLEPPSPSPVSETPHPISARSSRVQLCSSSLQTPKLSRQLFL
ncbi:hypothetical protein BS47DRAFT_317157 [Hydnum rufescens UP504]|uniref:Uncharacterized protein n=1 Tax=Hydnum rufescens UP504 TaxID=1448309 RepID=A0A9P6AKP7_9AGAM|nr:hypothetical protein BS47DRAFT_317157 [Hydnum rufescens UP504]